MISFEIYFKKWHNKTPKPLWFRGFSNRYLFRFAMLIAGVGFERPFRKYSRNVLQAQLGFISPYFRDEANENDTQSFSLTSPTPSGNPKVKRGSSPASPKATTKRKPP
jgi:hypothetical protein